MSQTSRSRSAAYNRLSSTLPPMRERLEDNLGTEVEGLAGADLSYLWDLSQFNQSGRQYGREFMTRMQHPFGEVLGILYLDSENNALAYHTCFKGDRPSALSHLPAAAKHAKALGATRVIIAYSMIFDPNATLPDVRRMHSRMAESGVDLYDFLLISPGNTRSLLAPQEA